MMRGGGRHASTFTGSGSGLSISFSRHLNRGRETVVHLFSFGTKNFLVTTSISIFFVSNFDIDVFWSFVLPEPFPSSPPLLLPVAPDSDFPLSAAPGKPLSQLFVQAAARAEASAHRLSVSPAVFSRPRNPLAPLASARQRRRQ